MSPFQAAECSTRTDSSDSESLLEHKSLLYVLKACSASADDTGTPKVRSACPSKRGKDAHLSFQYRHIVEMFHCIRISAYIRVWTHIRRNLHDIYRPSSIATVDYYPYLTVLRTTVCVEEPSPRSRPPSRLIINFRPA